MTIYSGDDPYGRSERPEEKETRAMGDQGPLYIPVRTYE